MILRTLLRKYMEDKQLKMAIIENNHAAWDEFDVKYREQFEYEAGRQ